MTPATPVETITGPAAMLARAIEMEQGSAREYNAAAQTCGADAGAVSKQLFERLVADEGPPERIRPPVGKHSPFRPQLPDTTIVRLSSRHYALVAQALVPAASTLVSTRSAKLASLPPPSERRDIRHRSGRSRGQLTDFHVSPSSIRTWYKGASRSFTTSPPPTAV